MAAQPNDRSAAPGDVDEECVFPQGGKGEEYRQAAGSQLGASPYFSKFRSHRCLYTGWMGPEESASPAGQDESLVLGSTPPGLRSR